MIYSTHSTQANAQKIVTQLVEEKLIACGNCFPIQSMYWWKGTIENDAEWVAILKTIPENWEKVQLRIEKLHNYEVPCIIKISVEANASYEAWIRASVELAKV